MSFPSIFLSWSIFPPIPFIFSFPLLLCSSALVTILFFPSHENSTMFICIVYHPPTHSSFPLSYLDFLPSLFSKPFFFPFARSLSPSLFLFLFFLSFPLLFYFYFLVTFFPYPSLTLFSLSALLPNICLFVS